MVSITWHGLEITGNVEHDAGVRTFSNGDPGYPASTEVYDIEIEGVDDAEEFSALLEEHEKPSEWKSLPQEARDWILSKWEDTIAEKFIDRYFEDR
jgi:hypothetical protein